MARPPWPHMQGHVRLLVADVELRRSHLDGGGGGRTSRSVSLKIQKRQTGIVISRNWWTHLRPDLNHANEWCVQHSIRELQQFIVTGGLVTAG